MFTEDELNEQAQLSENVKDAIAKQYTGGGDSSVPEAAAIMGKISAATKRSKSKPTTAPKAVETEAHDDELESGFEFDENFQSRIAALTVSDLAFVRRTEGLIKPAYFENEAQATLVGIAQEYFHSYHTLPTDSSIWTQVLKDYRDSKKVRADLIPSIAKEVKQLIASDRSDRDYVADKVSEFARNQAVQRAYQDTISLVAKGKLDDAQKIMDQAFKTSTTDDTISIDYWNDIERRTQYRRDMAAGIIKPDGIPTGIKDFDKLLYHKGWGRRELSCLMGGAKKGKSMGLGEFSIRASMLGYNALYITLEVDNEIIAERLDANVSDTFMNDLENHPNDVETKIKAKRSKRPGELRIAQYASGSLKPSGIRRLLERYKGEGITFDLIVVDYADIMAPEIYTQDSIENSRTVWLDLRAIAFEENAAVLTATQTNRDGFKSNVAKAEHAADDFNKVRTVDLMITINRDEEETAKGDARLYMAASRNQQGDYTIHIKQELGKMKFITKVEKMSA